MKSFYQKTILQRVDCLLVYTPEQQEDFQKIHSHVFTLKDTPKQVAAILRKAKSIYIHPDGFDYWVDILQVLNNQHPLPVKLFIFSGSDLTITDEHIEFWTYLFPNVTFWIQNYTGILPNCHIFPLGCNKSIEMQSYKKTEPLVISYFNPLNSEERSLFDEYLKEQPELAKYRLPLLSIDEYLESMKSAFFSVCPVGNGYDSIRFWESLSVGSIPLLIQSNYTEALIEQYPNLPFVVLKKWDDLPFFLTQDLLC